MKFLHQISFGAWRLGFRNGRVVLDSWCNSLHRCWHSWCMLVRHCQFHTESKDSDEDRAGGGELNMAMEGWRDGVGHENGTDAADAQPPLCLRQGRSPTRQHQEVPRKPPRLLISRVERE